MLENFPKNHQEATQEEVRVNFNNKEKIAINEAVGFLKGLEPEKYKKKAANLVLALSLFAGASSSFAEGQEVNKDNLPSMGEDQVSQVAEKNKIANFDWEEIVGKIEISAESKIEKTNKPYLEAVSPLWYESIPVPTRNVAGWRSEFYKDLSLTELSQAYSIGGSAISTSRNAEEFFNNINASVSGLNNKQKVIALQYMGLLLDKSYNYDMANAGVYAGISDDEMFQALKEHYLYDKSTTESGVCGNIHTFLVKTAEGMGLEAWLQSGSTPNANHVWLGTVVDNGDEKQIAFLDYGMLLPTGTLDYRDALGVAERYHKSISVFNSFVGNENEVLFPVKSLAQEVIGRATETEGASNRLGRNLEGGVVKKREKGLEIKVSEDIKEIKLNSDSVGLAFFNFKDSQSNPYQSMSELNATRFSTGLSSERFGVETGVTVLHMSIKDLYGGAVPSDIIVGKIAADYVEKKELTKNEYGQFLLNFGATIEETLEFPVGKKSGEFGYAFGGRLVYIDPNNIGKVYFGASDASRVQISDFQEYRPTIKEVEKKFIVGGEVKVFEGNIIKMEAEKSDFDWGESFNIKGGIESKEIKGGIGYEKRSSDYERFIPSSEKIEVEAGYRSGPKWEVSVIGSKTTKKYKDAESKDAYNAEVKLKILLW